MKRVQGGKYYFRVENARVIRIVYFGIIAIFLKYFLENYFQSVLSAIGLFCNRDMNTTVGEIGWIRSEEGKRDSDPPF